MEPHEDLLTSAISSISRGGQETLRKPPGFPCADETHEPFQIMEKSTRFDDEESHFIWGVVRTTGWTFEGDRTDIHDVLSLIWGGVLRAFGLGSVFLVDEPHVIVPGEIGARHLVFKQCPWSLADNRFVTARKSMNAWSAFVFHLLDAVFDWDRERDFSRPDLIYQAYEPKPPDEIARYLRFPNDIKVCRRSFPRWTYFASHDRGVTIITMPKIRVSSLKAILTPFAPKTVKGETAYAMFANGIPNAVPYASEKRARKLLSLVNDRFDDLIILPLDSHCLFIGNKTIIALRGAYGREPFECERQAFISRRQSENQVFFSESVIVWQVPLVAGDFEKLCLDLLRREPGVIRAKPVGTANDRDGGRDILVDWDIPTPHAPKADDQSPDDKNEIKFGGTKTLRVIAQVKSRLKTIGKNHVRDIRDTVEHYQADGFLLIAYPRISSALVDHLDTLGSQNKTRTDWWEISDIEERLRRHPDIAKRYPSLMTLHVTP